MQRLSQEVNIRGYMEITSSYITGLAQRQNPLAFSQEMGLLASVAVFKSSRGQGLSNLIYQALDHFLLNGLPRSNGESCRISSVHVMCSAPETMHLCQKYGYLREVEFTYRHEGKAIERELGCTDIKEVLKGLDREEIKQRFKEEEPRIEYYTKEL